MKNTSYSPRYSYILVANDNSYWCYEDTDFPINMQAQNARQQRFCRFWNKFCRFCKSFADFASLKPKTFFFIIHYLWGFPHTPFCPFFRRERKNITFIPDMVCFYRITCIIFALKSTQYCFLFHVFSGQTCWKVYARKWQQFFKN